ncbi:MAG: glycogen/starch/alpha-glucan phosphorylase [Rhodospirillales bacterium]|nr:glycogen/starch/alpha-glucan phosphorylase [Rhodospirillales bacterium]
MIESNPLSAHPSSQHLSATTDGLRQAIDQHLKYALGKDPKHATTYDWRMSLSLAVRDKIVDPWFRSTQRTYEQQHKRIYYLSMEFLIGRLLEDAVVNLGLDESARQALASYGVDYDAVLKDEPDAALGNGGLGRLAACFLESMSTIGCPAYGYGIRYEHGLFRQSFEDGRQIETAETWLTQRHAWEFERPEVAYEIGFGGTISKNRANTSWSPAETVIAAGYDTPIIGWQGRWANTLRLWSAKPTTVFDLEQFNLGHYTAAAEPEALARTISRVLYPDDTTDQGKELRLKQEYFFTAASIRDIVRRFKSECDDLTKLPERVAIQLNDTHPAIAGPELTRVLHDENNLGFEKAYEIAQACLSYTNHTLLPEALERWSEPLMTRILPRHMQLIEQIDGLHAKQNPTRPASIAIIEDGEVKMGELAFICAHKVNGVSALHTDLMKKTVFLNLHNLHPDRIVNQTNGVTPRRWLWSCNRPLSQLITQTIGDGWVDNLARLEELEPFLNDAAYLDKFAAAKQHNKNKLANWLQQDWGISVDPSALFDVQIKRIHEYKRQFMNILETIALWQAIRENPNGEWTPRVKIFGGKAAPGYLVAKEIIHLINDVARVINADPLMQGRLTVVYPANYNVSMAELLIPATDLSEQISTAGKEASGTGNMKFAMNGAPTIGTLDGANVEIRDCVGADNFFLFGMTAAQADQRRRDPNHSRKAIASSPELSNVLGLIGSGVFSPDEPARYKGLVELMEENDYFLVCADFDSYYAKQRQVDQVFQDENAWTRMAAANTARVGWFSSDRTIRSYMKDIWNLGSAL